jgi:hypothetical protein
MLHLILSHWKRIYFDSIEDDSITHLYTRAIIDYATSQKREKGERKMKKAVSGTMLTLLIVAMLAFASNIQLARADAPPPGEHFSTSTDNPLTTSYTLSGNLEVIVVVVPFSSGNNPSGTFVVSGIPSGSTIVEALMYHQEWGYSVGGTASSTLAGNSLDFIPPLTHDPEGGLDLAVYRWDVTTIVAGNGAYSFTTGGLEEVYGAALVVVYSNPANPSAEVRINDGAESMRYTTSSTTFSGVNSGFGKLIIYTEADNAMGETGETIAFNAVNVGGPIDANLGPYASLFALPVTTVSDTNTASITTTSDWFGWHLAILISSGVERPPRFLTLPFRDADIKLQQGWIYTYNPDPGGHQGIDYVKGTIDNSVTWQSFDVAAAAEGWAMQSEQPGDTSVYGSLVLIRHDKKDLTGNDYFTLYAHLKSVASAIPFQNRLSIDYDYGDPSKWKYVTRGEIIGEAGNTGATDIGIHLHFEVQRKAYAQYRTDPYDLYKTRDYYPGYSNYVGCGSDYLWIADPPYVLGNLKAISIEPVQVLWGTDLIQDKATDFRIGYESTLNVIVESDISLDLPGFAPSAYQLKHRFEPGRHYFIIGNEHASSPFFLAHNKPDATFRFTIDPGNLVMETDETDNTFPQSDFAKMKVVDTRQLSILFVPVRFDGEDGFPGYFNGFSRTSFEEHAVESVDYLKATYPVAESEISYYVACFNAPVNAGPRPTTESQANSRMLNLIKTLAERAGNSYNHIVGVVRDDWFTNFPDDPNTNFNWQNTVGFSWKSTSPKAVVVRLGWWESTAHEIGHDYDLTEYQGDDNGVGYYVTGRQAANAPTFMSATVSTGLAYRTPVPTLWIREDEYQILSGKLTVRTDPGMLLICGTFFRNGTALLSKCYSFHQGILDYEEGGSGNYAIAQLDVKGNVLGVVNLNVTFADEAHGYSFSEVPFAFTVPYADGTKTIQILNATGYVVASKAISNNAPTVRIVSPNGGEILTGDQVQISWEATDLDRDPLVYSVSISNDGGFTWNPIETGLERTTYDLPLTGFSGGSKYVIKVTASDGVNTAEDVSDRFFTIASFTLSVVTPPQNVPIGSRTNYTLSITSYGGFSDPIALTGSSPTTDKLIFRWLNGTKIAPVPDSSTTVVVEIEVPDVTETGHHTIILSGTSGDNTESAVAYLSAYEVTVPLDNTPPTTTLTIGVPKYVADGTYVTSKTPFRLEADDYAGSGVYSTAYRTYNVTYESGWLSYKTPFYLAALTDGVYTIEFNSTDNAGNVEPTNTATVNLDNTPPTTTLTIGEPKCITDTTYITPETPFTLEATDTGSGVYSTAYRIYNATYDGGWQTYTAPFKLTSLTDGTYTIEYNSTDNVKNVEITHTAGFTLFHWNYIYQDTSGRGTTLKINLAHKFFQFIAPNKDYGIRNATSMRQCGRAIIISHSDKQLRLITASVDTKIDFCYAMAWDLQTRKCYLLIDKAGIE